MRCLKDNNLPNSNQGDSPTRDDTAGEHRRAPSTRYTVAHGIRRLCGHAERTATSDERHMIRS